MAHRVNSSQESFKVYEDPAVSTKVVTKPKKPVPHRKGLATLKPNEPISPQRKELNRKAHRAFSEWLAKQEAVSPPEGFRRSVLDVRWTPPSTPVSDSDFDD